MSSRLLFNRRKNLIIIHEDHRENEIIYQALVYWKTNRLPICIFHEQNHWRPGIFNNQNNNKLPIQNSCICYDFPSKPSIPLNPLNPKPNIKK